MKTVLLKPQREIMNSVLAYEDEEDDGPDCSAEYSHSQGNYYAYWACDAYPSNDDCYYRENDGTCLLVENPSMGWKKSGRWP